MFPDGDMGIYCFLVLCGDEGRGRGGGFLVVMWGCPWGIRGGWGDSICICGDEGGKVFPCVCVVFLCGDVGGGGVVFPCEGVVILCGDVGGGGG